MGAKEFGDVPLKVINDGEVTALAGARMVGKGNLFGISMGSSEGAGYCNEDRNLMGWINECCYISIQKRQRIHGRRGTLEFLMCTWDSVVPLVWLSRVVSTYRKNFDLITPA